MTGFVKYTVILMVPGGGGKLVRAVGVFDTKEAAEKWAVEDGWPKDCFRILELWP